MTKPYDAQSASPTARVVINFQPDNGVFNGNGDFLDDVLGKNPAGRNALAQNGRFEMSCGKDGKELNTNATAGKAISTTWEAKGENALLINIHVHNAVTNLNTADFGMHLHQ